ncbi:hypothetical protein D9613_004919 [Agrocybe pediades]|uniref:Uncharacterized protein n=1 Tax=Agrocybe pediades TaxID=84607 RepID=A0A8H4R005_9AGAR|nr:hypothetical protein D9613_004919 [Agrocybe pediades]
MPPTLRSSSAQNSPARTSKTNALNDIDSNTTPTTTPRKGRQCSKCKQPRMGHPRSGCPVMDSPIPEDVENGGRRKANGIEKQLSFALENMALQSPGRVIPSREEEDKAFIRDRRRKSTQPVLPSDSLLSLSTETDEIVNRLLQPGALEGVVGNDSAEDSPSRILRWQETIAKGVSKNKPMKSHSSPGRVLMPGTLIPPTPETSFATTTSGEPSFKEEVISSQMTEPADDLYEHEDQKSMEEYALSSSNATERPGPLAPSMSCTERDIFVASLTEEAPATIYVIPKVDAEDIVAKARALSFIVHLNMNDDKNDPHALMILGRERKSVDALLKKVQDENAKAAQARQEGAESKGRSSLRTVAGAAVVGAVGAWAGLAFS